MNSKIKSEPLDWFFMSSSAEEVAEWDKNNENWKKRLAAKGPLPKGTKPYGPEKALQSDFQSGEPAQGLKSTAGQTAKWNRRK